MFSNSQVTKQIFSTWRRQEKIEEILMEFVCDNSRHLVCVSYSIENLHKMADDLGIKRCWFHKSHYDIPKKRIDEITRRCKVVSSKEIVMIIKSRWVNG
jgi:hypothetical protein